MKTKKILKSLWECVNTNDVIGARRLLAGLNDQARKFFVNSKRCNGPLFIAARNGNVDMVEFLAEECGADLEGLGIASIMDDKEMVTALWSAVAFKKFAVVKRLIKLGANVNAVSDVSKTPVIGALVMPPTSDKYPYVPTKFNSCEEKECIIHLFIIQFLIDHGADPFMKNARGEDVFLTASYYGRIRTLEELLFKFELEPSRCSTEIYELLGSYYVNVFGYIDIEKVLKYWRKGVEMRRMHPCSYFDDDAFQPHPLYGYIKEMNTVEELETLCQDHDFVYMRALMLFERIMGPNYSRMIPLLLSRGSMYERKGKLQLCIDIWRYAFQLKNACVEQIPIWYLRTWYFSTLEDLRLVFFRGHHERQQPNSTDTFMINFEDVFDVLQMVTSKVDAASGILLSREFQKDEGLTRIFMKSILHLIKLIIELDKNEEQLLRFKKHVYRLVHRQPKTQQRESLLHFSLKACTSVIPSIAVVELLLECGANVNDIDDKHNTALHLCSNAIQNFLMKPHHDLLKKIVVLLLGNKAHVDMVNLSGEKAAKGLPSTLMGVNIQNFVSLQCLAARAIMRSKIAYAGHVSIPLESFVEMHG